MINPKIVTEQGQVVGREGCLSVPDLTGNVSRAETIELEAQDGNGNPLNFKMEGFEARAVQHEMDHLDGLLFSTGWSAAATSSVEKVQIVLAEQATKYIFR